MEILDALRRAQAATGTTNAELARRTGKPRSSLTLTYSQARDPRFSTVARMCAAMGCELVVRLPDGEELPIGAGCGAGGPEGDA